MATTHLPELPIIHPAPEAIAQQATKNTQTDEDWLGQRSHQEWLITECTFIFFIKFKFLLMLERSSEWNIFKNFGSKISDEAIKGADAQESTTEISQAD